MPDQPFHFPTEPADESGRPYNPEMFAEVPDPTTSEWVNRGGHSVTQEQRTWEARMALHGLESFSLGVWLSPRTRLIAAAGILQAFDLKGNRKLMERERERGGVDERLTDEQLLDPGGEIAAFMEGPLGERVQALADELYELVRSCHECGRVHGAEPDDEVQVVAYVETATGESVMVHGADRAEVRVKRQVAEDRTEEELIPREEFLERFVVAENVAVLGEEGSS